MLTRAEIQRFPKAELHCHLDGSIKPHTLRKIARRQGKLVDASILEVTDAMVSSKDVQNLNDYLKTFDFVVQFLQTAPALEMAAYDVMEQAHADGVRYIEIRFAPSLSTKQGLTVAETIESVAKGIAKAEHDFKMFGNILVCGMRTDDEQAVRQLFQQSMSEKIVGMDLAGPEADGFVNTYQDALKLVVDNQDVQLTLHAGECGCPQNVQAAVEAGSKRIGHGIAIKGDEKVEKLLRDRDICIEGCPTSNVQTKAIANLADYPFQRWMQQGQQLCINTDNRTVSDTNLTEEYYQMAKYNGMTKDQLRQCNENAIRHSFADESVKDKILKEIFEFEITN
ncbi:adenosine deaminase [Fructilactobacillus lindneri]|uniref:adenosine deaminase n=2 Tax=Fructilactobacillus lindneri TaxID=53444 RepID=A0A0R2JNJ2_9LACO|nr:adenosine deaminase [Fructilactobacillus lindneri]ANZ57853.1 adenosine deaminase [Fructilactobacillus lindneri]ANZ59122.1 adenosine deaminase [Fructilactobacillus lindneri]KRN78689.1 adenosine deaminase [Fructilactobacillus lindneri DSM 20690 = JCM 11027]POG98174.1 adenosine deaminase [Fructilactobacillus lindneri]POH01710.1 adenosine deaminase [Fructilactobacillus lindneri]